MIYLPYFIRFKDRRPFNFLSYGTLSGSRWLSGHVGDGRKGVIKLAINGETHPVEAFELCAHPFVSGDEYSFGAEAESLLARDNHFRLLGHGGAPQGAIRVDLPDARTGMVYRSGGGEPVMSSLLLTPEQVNNIIPDDEARQIVERISLSGARIRITRFKPNVAITTTLLDLLKFGGYLDGWVDDGHTPHSVIIQGIRVPLRNIAAYVVVDPDTLLKEMDFVIARRVKNTFGRRIDGIIKRTDIAYRSEPEMPDAGSVEVTSTDGSLTFNIPTTLVRRASPDEQKLITEQLAIFPEVTDAMLFEHLGETLWSLISLHPTATVTRGLVFSRTEIQLKPDDDTKEKIIARLKENPAQLLARVPRPIVAIPDKMLEEGERWWRASLDLEAAPVEAENPLLSLNDEDLVILTLKGFYRERQVATQSRPRHVDSSLAVPARIVKLGRQEIINYLIAEDIMPEPDDESSDSDWENVRVSSERHRANPEQLVISSPGLDEFIPPDRTDEDGAPF